MTDNGPSESPAPVSGPTPSDDSAQALRLRADHPRITRLSRKVLAGGTALALLLISGAVLWALRSNHPHNPARDELYSTDHHNVADGVTTLPQDYAGIPRDVPRLGPPLPGDLGRPIVTAEGQSAPIGLDAEQQRANQETEAARTSKVFASTTAPAAAPHAPSQEAATNTGSSSDETFAQNGQDRKLLFVNAPVDRRTTVPDRLARPASPFVVQAGTITESSPPYPGGSEIAFEWQYSCSNGKDCSFSCPGAGSAPWPTASSSVATSAPLSRATQGGTHVTRLAIHLGTIPLGGTEKVVGIFYEFSTREIPRANGFSITTGISRLSCQVSGMDLDYSGPPRTNSLSTAR